LNDLTQNMALVTMAQLGVEMRRIQSMPDDDARFKCLREILWAVIFLQRNTAEAERLKQAERRKAGYRLSDEELEKQFWLWASDPEHKESIHRRLFMSKEEKQAAIDHILADDSDYWQADEAYIKSIGGGSLTQRPSAAAATQTGLDRGQAGRGVKNRQGNVRQRNGQKLIL
jgi:hypothetical protein